MRAIRAGESGEKVRDVQSRLIALGQTIDPSELEASHFGASTERAVRAFQQERSLLVDAIVGPATWEELVEASYSLGDRLLYLRAPNLRGDDVRALQERLDILGFDPGRADGIFGEQTDRAVRDFQRNVGLEPDGIVGATTLEALRRLRPPGAGPGRTAVREGETLRSRGSLAGRTIALDAGHGPGDPGARGPAGLTEAEAALTLVEEVADQVRASGATPVLLRNPQDDPTTEERVDRARRSGADALVSIHLNSHRDGSAEGASCYYFGRLGNVSVPGRALAEMVQDELTSRLGLQDGRTHPKAYPLLRETPMPAVQVEPCFITNPKEEAAIQEAPFRQEVGRAVTAALARFFEGRAD
ncbi:MAG TPA: peptidoglycan-binding protein [Actinomycetota bacterium]|nr:peptidoglycan-binding protein [Actinomycetota bacterium]